jgi:carbon-monoxide dehydrogenase medium subunit
MLPRFDLLMPQTLSEALETLAGYGPDALPVAGGTNLIPDMRGGKRSPSVVVNIAGLDGLQGIRREHGHLVIGSGVTIADLLASDVIAEHASVLKQAAGVFANPLVRNRATVGGNLGNASPAADTTPPLLVLDAEVELASSDGSRWVPLSDFFVHVCDTVCEPAELIAAIRWKAPAPPTFGGFRKLSLRKSTAVSVVSAAVLVTFDDAGRCEDARIALGAVAPTPIRAYGAEEVLRGEMVTPGVIDEATRFACSAASCIGDVRSSAGYRERVTGVLIRRLLQEAREASRE